MEFKIDWKIKNFEDIQPRKGQLLSSPTFVIDSLWKSQWALHLYPDGDNDGNGQYTALYLVRKSDDESLEDIMLDCQLSFENPKIENTILWKPSATWKTTNHIFKKGGRCGSQEFFKREINYVYLEHGNLTVRCVVFQKYANVSTSGGCVAVSLIGTDQRSFDWIIEDFQDMQIGDKKVTPVKSASKDAPSMTMALSLMEENVVTLDISPVDGRIKHASFLLLKGKGLDSPLTMNCEWFDETKSDQNRSFQLFCSKEYLMDLQTDSSLHLMCQFKFYLGIEFEKVEYTYYKPYDQTNKSCCIM